MHKKRQVDGTSHFTVISIRREIGGSRSPVLFVHVIWSSGSPRHRHQRRVAANFEIKRNCTTKCTPSMNLYNIFDSRVSHVASWRRTWNFRSLSSTTETVLLWSTLLVPFDAWGLNWTGKKRNGEIMREGAGESCGCSSGKVSCPRRYDTRSSSVSALTIN